MTTNAQPKEIVHLGATIFGDGKTLSDTFQQKVKNDAMAWYIDYYLEESEAERFDVHFVATEINGNVIRMTNEKKAERDPADVQKKQWKPEDVAKWFAQDGSTMANRWIFLCRHASGELYGVHCEPYRVFLFGPPCLSLPISNLWDDYVENGIHGPIRSFAEFDQSELYAIIMDPDVYGRLENEGLLADYASALASVLDEP
jgi:hypothetical protein